MDGFLLISYGPVTKKISMELVISVALGEYKYEGSKVIFVMLLQLPGFGSWVVVVVGTLNPKLKATCVVYQSTWRRPSD